MVSNRAAFVERTARRGAVRMGTRTVVRDARLARIAIVDLAVRRRNVAALSVGRLDPMGDEGARMVRTAAHRAFRAQRRLVRSRRCRMVRRGPELSRDSAALAGMDEPDPGS